MQLSSHEENDTVALVRRRGSIYVVSLLTERSGVQFHRGFAKTNPSVSEAPGFAICASDHRRCIKLVKLVVVACDAQPRFYAMAASTAVGLLRNVVTIVMRSKPEADWVDLVQVTNPAVKLLVGTFTPSTAPQH